MVEKAYLESIKEVSKEVKRKKWSRILENPNIMKVAVTRAEVIGDKNMYLPFNSDVADAWNIGFSDCMKCKIQIFGNFVFCERYRGSLYIWLDPGVDFWVGRQKREHLSSEQIYFWSGAT